MGCCTSASDSGADGAVNAQLRSDAQKAQTVRKILFLGPGGSGKSTLFRQVRRMYGAKFSETERLNFRDHIHEFVLSSLRALYIAQDPDYDDDEMLIPDLTVLSSEAQTAASELRDCGKVISETVAQSIRAFWSDAAVRSAFDTFANINLAHTCKHFIEDVGRLSQADYVPTDQDILWQRRTTTGLIEQQLRIDGEFFKMVDVGGQKSERRKWAHQFTDVSIVVFVVSLSSFDEKVWEDENANGLEIALNVFEMVCNIEWLVKPDIVLFFNKEDLFRQKLESGVRLKECPVFSEYDGDHDPETVQGLIMNKFRSKFASSKLHLRQSVASDIAEQATHRELHTQVTCAYNEQNIKVAFAGMIAALKEDEAAAAAKAATAAADEKTVDSESRGQA